MAKSSARWEDLQGETTSLHRRCVRGVFHCCMVVFAIGFIAPPAAQSRDDVFQFRAFEAERVTVMEEGGYWPTAVRLQNGELVVVARRGGPHAVARGGHLEMVRSRDGGRTWSYPVWVVGGTKDQDVRDGWLTQLGNGTLILTFHVFRFGPDNFPDMDHVDVFATRSHDNGHTWEIPVRVDVSPFTFGCPFGQIIELPSGTLLMFVFTAYTHDPPLGNIWRPVGERGFQGFIYRSRDGGKTWSEPSFVGRHEDDETHLLRLPSGKLLAAIRTGEGGGFTGAVFISESRDEGQTWHDLGGVTEPLIDNNGHLLLLRDGRVLLTYGVRAAPYFGVRAMLSRDEGKTWDQENRFLLVGDAPNEDCGYPTSIELPDGHIFTVYYQVDNPERVPASAKAKAVIWKIPK